MLENKHSQEIEKRERFEFGKNWKNYLKALDESRINRSVESLTKMLEVDTLENKSFVDIGCGSGLFSLAATRLGARVRSFDYDPESVACASFLKKKYAPAADWVIEEGSILDVGYISKLNTFDVVYSWGVLHHTGQMWDAIENAIKLISPKGKLFIAIYNDLGSQTSRWKKIKKLYVKLPVYLRPLLLIPVMTYYEGRSMLSNTLRMKGPFYSWKEIKEKRGMTKWNNWIDWIGGYPYEAAKPEEVFNFCKKRGLILDQLKTEMTPAGCNEFIFLKAGVESIG